MKTLSGPVHCIIDCMRMCLCNLVEFVVIVTQSNDIATNGFENVILFGGTHSQRTTPHFCNPMNEWIHWYTWMAIKSIPHRMKLSFCIFFFFHRNSWKQPTTAKWNDFHIWMRIFITFVIVYFMKSVGLLVDKKKCTTSTDQLQKRWKIQRVLVVVYARCFSSSCVIRL